VTASRAALVEGLGEKVEALIAAGKVPAAICVAAVEAVALRYEAIVPEDERLAPSEAMSAADSLINRMIDLQGDLRNLPIEVFDALANAKARRGAVGMDPIVGALHALDAAWGILELARREIDARPRRIGAPVAKSARLVWDLAAIVERAGGKVDATKSGALSSLIVLLPEFRNANPKQLNGIIKRALKKREQQQSSFGRVKLPPSR
jgi:hypothetical protein